MQWYIICRGYVYYHFTLAVVNDCRLIILNIVLQQIALLLHDFILCSWSLMVVTWWSIFKELTVNICLTDYLCNCYLAFSGENKTTLINKSLK